MDEREYLITSGETLHQHCHLHEDRRRKRHCFVGLLFLFLVLVSFLVILGASLSYDRTKPAWSHLYSNYIADRSIAINIDVEEIYFKEDSSDSEFDSFNKPNLIKNNFLMEQGIPNGIKVDPGYNRRLPDEVTTPDGDANIEPIQKLDRYIPSWFKHNHSALLVEEN
ncbi:CLUMA_CG017285, isoform A [Clunio marinus]|uniref:CLUMA_CG017285, isoform A n=1 Tax=Clunio marinus TaxID=568069 RepID=A0A1J1J007_9DIPT|nr:CLUMA_CG017285, isoform A [Clunio marinus]